MSRFWTRPNRSRRSRSAAARLRLRSASVGGLAAQRGYSSASASKKRACRTQPPTLTKGGTRRCLISNWAKIALDMLAEKDPTNARPARQSNAEDDKPRKKKH